MLPADFNFTFNSVVKREMMNSKLFSLSSIIISLLPLVCNASTGKQVLPKSLKTTRGELIYSSGTITLKMDGLKTTVKNEEELWTVKIQNLTDNTKEVVFSDKANKPEIINFVGGFSLFYNKLIYEGREWEVSLKLDFTVQGETFKVDGNIKSNIHDWVVTGFTGPVISGINADLESYPLIMPCGLGQKFTQTPIAEKHIEKVSFKGGLTWNFNKSASSYEIAAAYPSRFATMQWCALTGKENGLYFGSHDILHGSKQFKVRYKPETNTIGLGFNYDFTCFMGQTWTMPSLFVYPYTGTWHVAADYYRHWFDTSVTLQDVPAWALNAAGWMLTILKQQNEEIMCTYEGLDSLCTISVERGLDFIGLYGWAHGGHDRFYPDYHPDPALGGREALVKALKKIHEYGKHAIIYVNGQLIDMNGTAYWDEQGKKITVVKKDGSFDFQKWHKYTDAQARYHGMACLGCDEWYDRMLELALQANELGADGIIYDQLAVTAPKFCYSPDHGHSVPAVVYAGDRYRLLQRIADYMKTVNPDFIIMTEGLCDAVLGSVSYFHGYENGVYVPLIEEFSARLNGSAPTHIYPEMFKYTFPEMLTTTRNPSPVNNRLILNYATMYGLRQELESRYRADVRYLEENRVPVPEDYANVISKPVLDLVTSQDPVAMKIYTRQVIDFQRENSEILWKGKFVDAKGFNIRCSSKVIAKAYETENRIGIVVWNTGSENEFFTLEVPGYTYEFASAPGKVDIDPSAHLPAESICLIVWKKSGK